VGEMSPLGHGKIFNFQFSIFNSYFLSNQS
jgi:hypothetical protein